MAQAAVKVRGRVFTGSSHKVAVFAASLALDISPGTVWTEARPEDQGFVTSRGRFVSRAKAWALAKERGQLRWDRSRPGITPELQSEDLR